MSDTTYTPPKVWTWDAESGGNFANINRPIAGATHDKTLPVGEHPFQLYSLATPNGVKVTILFEELLPHLRSVEMAGDPRMVETNFVGGYKALPIRFTKN